MCSKLYVYLYLTLYYMFLSLIGNSENLGDGFCDASCNIPQCAFDLGDCKDVSSTYSPERPSKSSSLFLPIVCHFQHHHHYILFYIIESRQPTIRKSATNKERCNEGCPFLWIGDGVGIRSFSSFHKSSLFLTSPLVLRSQL